MALRKKESERSYYLKHITGGSFSAQTPFQTVARTYYLQYLNSAQYNSQTPLDQLFVAWAKKWISTNGGQVPATKFTSDLMRALVVAIGKIPSRNVNDNYILFFANAA